MLCVCVGNLCDFATKLHERVENAPALTIETPSGMEVYDDVRLMMDETDRLLDRNDEKEDTKHDDLHSAQYVEHIRENLLTKDSRTGETDVARQTGRGQRECANMTVWAIPALVLHEEAGKTTAQITPSESGRLQQVTSAAEKDQWKALIVKTIEKQKKWKKR